MSEALLMGNCNKEAAAESSTPPEQQQQVVGSEEGGDQSKWLAQLARLQALAQECEVSGICVVYVCVCALTADLCTDCLCVL
jgi:hypothetical protein